MSRRTRSSGSASTSPRARCCRWIRRAAALPRSALGARRNAWVKLWKHHAAQPQADRINAAAARRGEAFLADYGGRTSSEWLAAKALQILEEDPEV